MTNVRSNNIYQIPWQASSAAVVDSMYPGPQQRHPSLAFTDTPLDNLNPIDAPTQSMRYYSTPVVTSREEIPSLVSVNHPHIPTDEEEDEFTQEPLAANATDEEKLKWRRRHNALAAKRSRKRKFIYQQQLETSVDQLTRERDMWRNRAMILKQLLHTHGIPFPEFQD
ncbi:hypothetical protein BDQ17DRAFT_1374200 [Cyathus striatus]|nr:hypothetical protein BDQ17DRAFT_1374200 [Cyathus striatus]